DQRLINSYQQVEIDKTLTRLCDAMGKSERIRILSFRLRTVCTFTSLYLFISLLPFRITEHLGGILVPVVIFISVCFLFIEKMANTPAGSV
ncbi:MAG: bestrophin family ion channel, partial [Chryseolinea sp.]